MRRASSCATSAPPSPSWPAQHGLAPIAASTHPFADWSRQMHTDKERYNMLARDLQALGGAC
jgi:gamma-glutamyl:cysteine ligase YbdK (ATP-grasp superfamily)